ncbi:MAG: DNA-deoxyinosine glycosylase [Gammaproteobacteria bacterium]|nr:DNA-deoxyinosine glycosylase [Gammaproteobacteria bacterium]MCW8923631.1 DNA-deoxyinosine glycosylase [Gammaproteobacteria bacterium]
MKKHTCFPPASLPDAELLIVGSMPGKLSLEYNQYYAHPRNLFWQIMYQVLGIELDKSYESRIKELNQNKIALWDVIRQCEREGSLDSSINSETEEVNDFAGFLSSHQAITRICFNGKKAFLSFKKNILSSHSSIADHYDLIVLPSTSPANASIPRDVKIAQWQDAIVNR